MKLWAAEFILFAYSVWILPLQWLNYGLFHFDLDSNLYFSSSLLHFILSFRIFFYTRWGFFYNCSDVCEALLLIIAPSRGEMLCHRRGYLIPSDCVLCQMLMTDLIKDVFLNCLFYQKTELLRNTSLILKFHIKVPAVKECRQQELSNQWSVPYVNIGVITTNDLMVLLHYSILENI